MSFVLMSRTAMSHLSMARTQFTAGRHTRYGTMLIVILFSERRSAMYSLSRIPRPRP